MNYLLDTNICVFCLRGKLDLMVTVKNIERYDLYISEVTLFELRYGAENSDNPEKIHSGIDSFLDAVKILPITDCISKYAKEKARLRKIGKPMHDDFDLLIGVTSIEHKMILVTDNVKDFERLEGIKIENWMARKTQ